jgi:HSP20 family protein
LGIAIDHYTTSNKMNKMRLKTNQAIFSDVLINNFGQIVNEMLSETTNKPQGIYRPPFQLSENDEQYMLQLSLPGVNKQNISINQEEHIIKIEAHRATTASDYTVLHSEFNHGKYVREVRLPKNASLDAISAKLQDGLLTLFVQKKEESKPKSISIT